MLHYESLIYSGVCVWLIYAGSLYSSSAEKVHYWSSSGRRWFSQRLPIIWLHWQVMQNPLSLYNYTVFCIIWREQEKGEEWEYFAVLVFVCGSSLFSDYRKCHLAANMYCTNTWWHTWLSYTLSPLTYNTELCVCKPVMVSWSGRRHFSHGVCMSLSRVIFTCPIMPHTILRLGRYI